MSLVEDIAAINIVLSPVPQATFTLVAGREDENGVLQPLYRRVVKLSPEQAANFIAMFEPQRAAFWQVLRLIGAIDDNI